MKYGIAIQYLCRPTSAIYIFFGDDNGYYFSHETVAFLIIEPVPKIITTRYADSYGFTMTRRWFKQETEEYPVLTILSVIWDIYLHRKETSGI